MTAETSLHVLLVEDSPGERWLMAEILRSRGHTVTACERGAGALEAWESMRFPLVVLDWVLPDGPGSEVCRELRSRPGGSHVVIVVVTGKDDTSSLEEVLAAGADDYIAKPFDVALLHVRLAVAENEVRNREARRAAEQALAFANQELETLFRNLGDVFFSVDLLSNRLIQVSPASETLLGVPREELIREPERWHELLPGHNAESIRARIEEAEEDQEVVLAFPAPGRRGEEEPRWLEASLRSQRNPGGEVVRIDGVVSDVTGRRRSQEELATRNRELLTLHRISEVTLGPGNLQEGYAEILEIICRDTGFPVAIIEWQGDHPDTLYPVAARGVSIETANLPTEPRKREEGLSLLAYRTGAPQAIRELQLQPMAAPAAIRDMALQTLLAFPIQMGGAPAGTLLLAHSERLEPDARLLRWGVSMANHLTTFTDRMRNLEALRRSEARYRRLAEDLERANREMQAFGYTVSHDLRAPLRTMQGFAHTLLQRFGSELKPEALDYLRRIIASGEHSERLIEDLLAYARMSHQVLAPPAPVSLSEVVAGAVAQLHQDLQDAGASVEVEEGLPPVLGNSTILMQAVANLLSNAAKFGRDGVPPRIVIRHERIGSDLRLWVEDDGMGIPEGQADRIFRTFERLPQSQARPGTGIGLAVVRLGLERLGGRCGVERNQPHGSRFWIELPAALAPQKSGR